MRMLRYTGYCNQVIEVDLDTRPDPIHVRGSIIMAAQVAVGLPLRIEAEIRPEGEIVVRGYDWSGSENPYWHCAEYTIADVAAGQLVLTPAQRATIWRLWAGKHPFRSVNDNGVGRSLLLLTGESLDDAAQKYLDGQIPP